MEIDIKKMIQLILIVIITVAFIYFIKHNIQYIKKVLVISPWLLLLIVALNMVNRVLGGMKINQLTRSLGIKLFFWEGFGLAAIVNFYNYLFSKSGTAMAAMYLKKKHNLHYSNYIGLSLADFIMTLIISGIIGCICAVYGYYFKLFKDPALVYIFLMLIVVCITGILFLKIKLPSNKYFDKLNRVAESWNTIKKNKRLMANLLLMNFIIVCTYALRYYIIFRLFSNEIPLFVCLMISPFNIITQIVSIIPGAYGLREVVTGVVSKLADIGFVPGALATLVDRVIMMFVAFILGTFFSLTLLDKSTRKELKQ